MQEDFVQYIWRHQLFEHSNLKTTEGLPVQIISSGILNEDEGPDFFSAKLKIDDQLWGGNVEIHLCGKEWYLHGHQKNSKYNNVILHVIWTKPVETRTKDNSIIPTIVLKNKVDTFYQKNYFKLIKRDLKKPCSGFDLNNLKLQINKEIERSVSSRIENKITQLGLQTFTGNKPELFYRLIISSFGFGNNSPALRLLAQLLPYSVFIKLNNSPLSLESIIYGVSGFLNDEFTQPYQKKLKEEWHFLRNKYQLSSIPTEIWKFSKLRPYNSPYIRLAQLTVTLSKFKSYFIFANSHDKVFSITNPINNYWASHLNLTSKKKSLKTSELPSSLLTHLMINAVIPYRYLVAKDNSELFDLSTAFENTSFEHNKYTRLFKFPIKKDSAFVSQGLLELHHSKCVHKKCLNCAIGAHLIKKGNVSVPPI